MLLSALSACSEDGADDEVTGTSAPWVLGTTETVTALDPAGSDTSSWNIQYNVFEQLMRIPPGGEGLVGDAAESCVFDDPQTVTCELREGLVFSNGNELTSSDVRFSLERNIAIADPLGSSWLLGSISNSDAEAPALTEGAIETPDDLTVIFHLNNPDTTFLKLLATAATSILDEQTFPADDLLADDQVVGSGPYMISQYKPGEQIVFEANPEYDGERSPKAKQVIVQYFSDTAPLKTAIENGEIDVAWRTLGPTDLKDLEQSDKVQVRRGDGAEFRYFVWDVRNEAGKERAVRQAAAQIIDREAIAANAYDGTVTPAYSLVPPGFGGQKNSFEEKYGPPNVDAAAALLEAAGVETPVQITMAYTPTHYGPNAVDEANEFADQLTSSGLFEVQMESAEWEEYRALASEGAYDLFQYGWFPDITDADNYLTPFIRDGGFFGNGYSSEEVNMLLDQELAETDPAAREAIIGQLQDIVAEDVPVIPSWNGQNVAVFTDEMSGVEETLDQTYIFRLWGISKGG